MFFRTLQTNSRKGNRLKPQLGRANLGVRFVACLGLLSVLLAAHFGFQGQAQTTSEYELKALVLSNFPKFIEWTPESFSNNTAPFVVGVVGDDPFNGKLDQTLEGKSLNARPVVVKHFKKGQNLRECHLLFISGSEQQRLAHILENLKGSSVLTVSDINSFCQKGGVIGLELENKKIRFVVNLDTADQARLRISSKLLALAKSVLGERRAGR